MELETKAFGGEDNREVKTAFEDFLAGFETFKENNDARLKGLEKRSADVCWTRRWTASTRRWRSSSAISTA
jgi:hypothetical protein